MRRQHECVDYRSERQYPDIIAVGEETVVPNFASNSASSRYSGTSLAAPHVAGAAYLLIAGPDNSTAATGRTALMARSAILATDEDITAENSDLFSPTSTRVAEDYWGAGFLRTDMLTARENDAKLTVKERTEPGSFIKSTFTVNVVQGKSYSVALAWFRTGMTTLNPAGNWVNLDLRVIEGSQIVTSASLVAGTTTGTRRPGSVPASRRRPPARPRSRSCASVGSAMRSPFVSPSPTRSS